MRHVAAAVAALSVGCAAMAPSIAQAADMVIRFSHVVAENTPKGMGAKHFETCVEETLPGTVDVDVYPNSQLFDDDDVLEAMLRGDVHIAAPSLSKFNRYTDALSIFDLPFLFDDLEAAERFQQSDAGQELLRAMEDDGILGLAYWHNGMKQMSAGEPLRTPADAEGKTFRIMASDVLAAQFEAVEAVPVKKPFSEVFTLLQTQAIDGQENTWSNIYSKKFFEVQPYITETDHGLLDYLVVTNSRWWNGLDDDEREAMTRCMDEATEVANATAFRKAMADRQRIIESGVSEVVTLTPEEKAQWREAMRPVWQRFEDLIGKDLIDAALAANSAS